MNRSGSVCPLEKRAGKTKSGVSTPVKTKRGSSKKQDTPSSRANAKDALDPSDRKRIYRKRIYSRGYHRERTSWKNRGFDVSSAACKEAAKSAGQEELANEINRESDLENACDAFRARSIGSAKFPPKTRETSSVAPQRREPASCRHRRLQRIKAALGYLGCAPRFTWARIPTTPGDRFHAQTSVVQLKRSEPSSSCPACHPHTRRMAEVWCAATLW